MKAFLLISIALMGVCQAQTMVTLIPSCKQTIKTTDTANIFGQLSTTQMGDVVDSISFTLLSGPSKVNIGRPVMSWYTGAVGMGLSRVTGFSPGTYIFKLVGITSLGNSVSTTDSLLVVSPPPVVAPRTLISSTWKLVNGAWVATQLYSDGTTQ